ncbi:hypothetical protein JQ554_33400 [Bradyrhizobium diazoefficiens]|nr:hypothetical protein [Bradyrhizobium diazoefficiens]MBR0966978.1 hypothetical protein [Bradyrhizobium diazoefficiens]MBR0979102.1 hypothetical protein [Bradyrhizobium diazoefficiens]MBR1119872.1 hypothetical protein [Bradyrhizobium diazoefficiens]
MSRTDLFGWLLLASLTALALAAGAAFLEFAHVPPWGLALGLFMCVAFVAVGLGAPSQPSPRNTGVYGSAKAASESEAQAAARGEKTSPSLHDRTFPN